MGSTLNGPLNSHPPDGTSEATLSRRNTITSSSGFSDKADTCRICRSEATDDDPLFYPCKCSGSIKYVHQDCLIQWLNHSSKKHCELCKTPFRFTKLYDAQMPAKLPWNVFFRRACVHAFLGAGKLLRGVLVAIVWLIVLPWLVRWAWRWMFWFADAGWARQAFVTKVKEESLGQLTQINESDWSFASMSSKLGLNISVNFKANNSSAGPTVFNVAKSLITNLGLESVLFNSSSLANSSMEELATWPHADASLLSSFTYLAELTPSTTMNRIILDITEGQLITCVVITGFILVFLIREWVVQQQPLVNLDNLGNVNQQLREAAEREQGENERLRRQQELLQQARRRLVELQQENERELTETGEECLSWEEIEHTIDIANQLIGEKGDVTDQSTQFKHHVDKVMDQLRAASRQDTHILEVLTEKLTQKLMSLTPGQRKAWEDVLVACIKQNGIKNSNRSHMHDSMADQMGHLKDSTAREVQFSEFTRPPMPERHFSSRATHIQRLLEETEGMPHSQRTKLGIPLNTDVPEDNAFRPENPQPAEDSLGSRVLSMFQEEFGLDEIGMAEPDRLGVVASDGRRGEVATNSQEMPSMGYLERLVDWFWGDLHSQNTGNAFSANEDNFSASDENVPPHQEALSIVANDNVEHHQSQLAIEGPPVINREEERLPHHDREMLAEAQGAGLDADALEEAEDLEGIFELIGFHGPLVGLFQTSTFCTVLVILTVFGAVGVPYTWGKIVLNFLGSPGFYTVQMPLHVISFATDFLVDSMLFIGGLGATMATKGLSFILAVTEMWWPVSISISRQGWMRGMFIDLATIATIGTRAGGRLSQLFLTQEGWDANWAFLEASTSAHASLRLLEEECSAVLNWLGHCITTIVESTSEGSIDSLWSLSWFTIKQLYVLPSLIITVSKSIGSHMKPLFRSLGIFVYPAMNKDTVNLGFSLPFSMFDPSLIYWSAGDRFLAVTTGYMSLACIAAIYVAIDLPITQSEAGRKTEKLIRDTLRQAGGVLKVILIISIEMLIFPLYCGLLLDFAFLPLFEGASVATRWAFAMDRPMLFGFIHWFIGTCYMFHFALFVGMCRKILRRGVLWFIRDPDDPTFHPVRDVLERGVGTQLRKIAFSALVYGALVILCLGGVIWGIGKLCRGIFPIYWVSTEPVLEFPMDLLLYNAVTPVVIRLLRPSEAVNTMYAWWLRRCARMLRLSHFLFGERREEEEGHVVKKSWITFLLKRMVEKDKKSKYPRISGSENHVTTNPSSKKKMDDENAYFQPSGKYVLTPCNDQYRPPKPGEAFLHYKIRHNKISSDLATSSSQSADQNLEQDDVYIADRDGKKNDHFAKVYVPPHFRVRITLFMVCLWIFSAFTGLCATLVPLCFGRQIFASFVTPAGTRVNDIYAYSVGAYILGGLIFAVLQGRKAMKKWKEGKKMMPVVQVQKCLLAGSKVLVHTLKCGYVYGFIVVVLPTLFALLLQFYLVLPLHTYILSLPFDFSTTLAHHTIHILQDYCLGLLYLRLFARAIFTHPTSVAAEAFRRITAKGYFNPDIRLTTRALVLPTLLFSIILLLAPPAMCWALLQFFRFGDTSRADQNNGLETVFYRYSYPISAIVMLVMLGVSGMGRAVEQWRAKIKDEVYLVGERLHNFGEKRPAAGSKTLLRKL
ncbi:hypothetical protein M433DRAFT_70753 [Acidomyces richmondensis BFW]|nr:MAG: hypothetical protein FE78DRAFT_153962 [Acidomyces sp. 'richmondensis']KYG43861.1 hypothetical protein M433DRAFT_70753 [Acidomyces richmondensis BFW]